MKSIDIGEWLTDLVNGGELEDKKDFLVEINGREIMVIKTKCDSDGDINFVVVKPHC